MHLICSPHGDGGAQVRISLAICEITNDAIRFGEDAWIDRSTWVLAVGHEEYALSLSYDSDGVGSGQYRVESYAIRFMAEHDYRQSEMLHPKWLGCEVFSVDGDPWGFVVDYEEDGYRKNDGRFVFHDTYNMSWEFGTDHRTWAASDRVGGPERLSDNDGSTDSANSTDSTDACANSDDDGSDVFPDIYPNDSNIVLVVSEADCNACGNSTGRWTWHRTNTDENWCHLCHVRLHGVEFECPACDRTVQSIRWGNEGWCDGCEQELWC